MNWEKAVKAAKVVYHAPIATNDTINVDVGAVIYAAEKIEKLANEQIREDAEDISELVRSLLASHKNLRQRKEEVEKERNKYREYSLELERSLENSEEQCQLAYEEVAYQMDRAEKAESELNRYKTSAVGKDSKDFRKRVTV